MCVCVSSVKSLPLQKSHMPVDPRTQTHARPDAAERECGIVRSFGAGGLQLFGLLLFDPGRPLGARRSQGSQAAQASEAQISQMCQIDFSKLGAANSSF